MSTSRVLIGSEMPPSGGWDCMTTVILRRSRSMDRVTETCPQCGARTDVSNLLPLSEVFCGQCQGVFVARRLFERFQVEELLGRGGMGAVYKAMDVTLGRRVALKILRQELSNDEDFVARLAEEAKITASVSHPTVIRVFGQGACHGMYYIIFELITGGSLAQFLAAQGPIPEEKALSLGIQIASALGAAAKNGLLHRDVKPGNILFGQGDVVKLVDFGLSSFQGAIPPSLNEVWGSAHYIAPEKLDGLEDFRSDMYSLGATLFHALAGRPVFKGENDEEIAQKHVKNRAPNVQTFVPTVSKAAAYCINRMLERDPADRYQSYEELIEHLQFTRDDLLPFSVRSEQDGGLSSSKGAPPDKRGTKSSPKRRVYYGAAALLAAAAIAGGAFALPQKTPKVSLPAHNETQPTMIPLNTPALGPTVYEAEDGLLFGTVTVATDHHNFSGAGFVAGFEDVGAANVIVASAPAAGFYKVRLHYANAVNSQGVRGIGTISIYVNGSKIRQTSLPSFDTWDEWGDVTEILPFNKGSNTITYQRDPGDTGRINIDYIEVSGATR